MKILRWLGKALFVICLPALLISGSLAWGFNSSWILEFGFNKYDIAGATGLSNAELEAVANDWVRYINSSDIFWSITVDQGGRTVELFTPEEQIHFHDVKDLIRFDYYVGIGALLVILGYALIAILILKKKAFRELALNLVWGSGLTLAVLIILGVASLINFDGLFIALHHLIFTNSYWSAEGYMLLLFPDGFWFDAAMICTAFTAGMALILGLGSLFYLRRTRRIV